MTSLNGIFGVVYEAGNWLAKIMYLHILWVLFTLLGGVVFGLSPSTASLFRVIYKWFDEDFDIPIFQTFYTSYKAHFMKANGLGLTLIGTGLFLYFDLNVSKQFVESFALHLVLLIFIFLFFITTLYVFTIFARYELSFWNYFKQSFFIALARPMETIAILISLLLLFYLFRYVPVLLFFMGSSIIAYPITWFSYLGCIKIEEMKASN